MNRTKEVGTSMKGMTDLAGEFASRRAAHAIGHEVEHAPIGEFVSLLTGDAQRFLGREIGNEKRVLVVIASEPAVGDRMECRADLRRSRDPVEVRRWPGWDREDRNHTGRRQRETRLSDDPNECYTGACGYPLGRTPAELVSAGLHGGSLADGPFSGSAPQAPRHPDLLLTSAPAVCLASRG